MIRFRGELLYKILKPIAKAVFYHKFNIIEEDYVLPEKGEAFIVVGHHVSAFDPIILNSFSKRLIRFLYADANEQLKIRSKLLVGLDMIPFSKNSADFKSIRILKERVKNKQAIGIYPEGGASWDGKTDELIIATSKLIKMMKVPVYGIRYNGAYLSKPRWAKNTRKGKVVMNTYQVFTQDQIENLNFKEIHKKLVETLFYDEYLWQKETMVKFKGKDLAEYIERLVYKCPNCMTYNTFSSKGDLFTCSHCQLKLKYNDYGLIEKLSDEKWLPFEYNLSRWNKWQHNDLTEKLSGDFKEFKKLINMPKDNKILNVLITINDQYDETHVVFGIDHIIVNGVIIKFKDIKSQSITFAYVIEFYHDNNKYHLEFTPEASISIKLFYDCLEYFKEVSHESKLG